MECPAERLLRFARLVVGIAFGVLPFARLVGAPLTEGESITFAIPASGHITLAVFDMSGQIVRHLHSLSPEADFRVDLNGFATRWDGKNDAGTKVPPGRYHIRGYLIANLSVEGDAYLFNDWITDEAGPQPARINDVALLDNGDVIVLASDPANKSFLARTLPDHGLAWAKFLPEESGGRPSTWHCLTANGTCALAAGDQSLASYLLSTGEAMDTRTILPLASSIVADNDRVLATTPDGLFEWSLSKWMPNTILRSPPSLDCVDAASNKIVVSGPDGIQYRESGPTFQKIPLSATVHSLAIGSTGTFWAVCSNGKSSDRLVAQFNAAGEVLRALRPDPSDPQPDIIRASHTSERIVVLESAPSLQRLRALDRNPDGTWSIAWQKSIENCKNFGFSNDRPVANAGNQPLKKSLPIALEENPLTGKRENLTVRAEFDKSGTRLVSAEGLLLAEVSPRPDIHRIAVNYSKPQDALVLLQGNGTVVEEFSITGLRKIIPIDAGDAEVR